MTTSKKTSKKFSIPASPLNVVAEICFYGTHNAEVGYGYYLTTHDGKRLGDGTPRPGRTATEALWIALGGLEILGYRRVGLVRIYDAGGERCADLDLSKPSPIYGEIRWVEAPVYTLNVDELIAAAEKRGDVETHTL